MISLKKSMGANFGEAKGEQKVCWYCDEHIASQEHAVPFSMYKLLERSNKFLVFGTSVKTTYATRVVSIPRCVNCAKVHSTRGVISIVISFIMYLVSLWYIIFSNAFLATNSKITAFVVITILGLPILFLIVSFIVRILYKADRNDDRDYPEIVTLLADGWASGNKPVYKGRNYKSQD